MERHRAGVSRGGECRLTASRHAPGRDARRPSVVMKASGSISRRRLWMQFFVGLFYFSGLTTVVCEITRLPFFLVLPGLLAAVAVCAGLALTWATLWARRDDGRLGQFGIGSLLFLTVFAALFFGLVRWIEDAVKQLNPTSQQGAHFGEVAIGVLVVSVISIPFAIGLTESVIWLAVCVLRRPTVRRLRGKR